MIKKKILFICGSLNQTTMMHQIYEHLREFECYFTPYYADGFVRALSKTSLLDFSLLGGQFRKRTIDYLYANSLNIDFEGSDRDYDLVFTCSDLIVPKNIRNRKIILVQEGMTDPENFWYRLVKTFKLPRYLASTSTTGLSDAYTKFCVASEGYRDFFINKGVKPEKIVVTGLPNFDNCVQFLQNDFPYRNFVLAATSDARETYKFENRKKFIKQVIQIAEGRPLIFKLHPNELTARAEAEIKYYAPDALVFSSGKIEHMIANCDVLITKYSSVVYVGLVLGKEVYSAFNLNDLKKMIPIQNGGTSARNIARAALNILNQDTGVKVKKEINAAKTKNKFKNKALK